MNSFRDESHYFDSNKASQMMRIVEGLVVKCYIENHSCWRWKIAGGVVVVVVVDMPLQ